MILNIFAFIFGAAIGSFLNVCIFRIPAKESIVRPLSQCPHCHHPIRFFDNIPIVSFLLLRANAVTWGKISWRHPLVELITAVMAPLAMRFGLTLNFWFLSLLLYRLCSHIDHQIIPDARSLPVSRYFSGGHFYCEDPAGSTHRTVDGGACCLIAFVCEMITNERAWGEVTSNCWR